ncbi:MAG: tRNA (guanosine(46)-N7)-methyltransferase TrmB [Cytophagales bacterium]|nr:tRNA (guanosine(46)-N7)-methyltransferase TrmB [Cytophagales bacterium]
MRKKLQRFYDNAQSRNVIEPDKPIYKAIKGKWRSLQFKNQHPIVVELACGKGAYTVQLAALFPDKNLIGVDIKGARIWVGSRYATANKLENVAFLRTNIEQVDQFFEENEVDELWITFPDPRPRKRDEKRRLTSPLFLNLYRSILRPGGIVHLKTDNAMLFAYTIETLHAQNIKQLVYTEDLYQSNLLENHYGIQTPYEKRFLEQGKKIKYLCFVPSWKAALVSSS